MKPKTKLTITAPQKLKGHATAALTWKRIVGLYLEIEGDIATAFDYDLLIKYCLLEEEVIVLAEVRDQAFDDWETNHKAAKRIKPNPDTLKDWLQMWKVVNGMLENYKGLDARLDGKRKLLLSMSQSLYLTPRSRAGVAPPEKEPTKPKSEMGKLLD